MLKGFVIGVMLCSFVFWASPAPSEPDVREGSWGITMLSEVPGTLAGLPIRYTNCITKKNIVPQRAKSSCAISDITKNGNSISWIVRCENENIMSEGKGTYAGTTFEGIVITTTSDGDKKTQIRSTLKGQYLGPCQ